MRDLVLEFLYMNRVYSLVRKAASALLIGLIVIAASGTPAIAEAAKSSKPTIKITSPSAKATFAKDGSGFVPVAWTATNVPEDTLVVVELKVKKLAGGTGVGGGAWQGEIAAGDSSGSHKWDIEGAGRAQAGTYKVRVYLQQCAKGDCSQNPDFPGKKKTKIYATSKWVNIKIVDDADEEDELMTPDENDGPVGVSVAMVGGSGSDEYHLDTDSSPMFNYYPSGDVTSCTITAYYQGGEQKQASGWKNGVRAGDYGRFSFSAVGPYPLQSLKSVEVVCGNASQRANDSIRFTVGDSAEADFKILTGKSGASTYKKGSATRGEAESLCSKAYNDPKIHKYTRVQCYWDGEKFEDVREFKG